MSVATEPEMLQHEALIGRGSGEAHRFSPLWFNRIAYNDETCEALYIFTKSHRPKIASCDLPRVNRARTKTSLKGGIGRMQ